MLSKLSFQPRFWLVKVLLLCLILLGLPLPVLAANQVDPHLEEQILQVISTHPEVIIKTVRTYQQQQQEKKQQELRAFSQELTTNPKGIIRSSPTNGLAESKIVLVEFSDFQCPYCAEAHKTLKRFMKKHRDEITLTYKHLPLNAIHPEAMSAASAAWAAGQQGKFWEYHDALFAQQKKLGENLYLSIAKTLKLNLDQFNKDRNGDAANAAIHEDIHLAEKLGISGTPFFVMNHETFSGVLPETDIENIIARVRNSL
jgi:protein-disulfide isomerase